MPNFMRKEKFQNNFKTVYDEQNKVSIVTFNNELGKFEGRAYLEDDDEKSNFWGFFYAESKANIKYYKMKIRVLNEQRKILVSCLENFNYPYNNYDNNPKIITGMIKEVSRQITRYYGYIRRERNEIENAEKVKNLKWSPEEAGKALKVMYQRIQELANKEEENNG